MSEYQGTFKRYEKKYLVTQQQYNALAKVFAARMVPDRFAESTISNIYYDTPDFRLIRRSLDRPAYKEKLRLRWYGTPTSGERVYVEIKKKYDGIVYKRRVGCSLTAAYAYLMGRVPYENACVQNPLSDQVQQDEALTLHSIQIAREIDAFAARYRNLRPSMYIVCERTAYAPVPGADADGLRITFDSGVAYRAGRRARSGQHLPSAFGPGRDDYGGEDRRCLPVLAGRGARRMPGVSVVVQQVRRRLPGVRTCRRRPFRS